MISAAGLGILLSAKLRDCVLICRELLNFCDILSIDISTRKNSVISLIEENSGGRLSFLNKEMLLEKSIARTPLGDSDNAEIGTFIYSLGKSDTQSQLLLIESFREYIKARESYYKEKYIKDSKLNIAMGVSGGIIIALTVL